MKIALSAVVITKNEESHLVRCLESVRFCDEIVVVDAESTDRTCEIARKYTNKVFSVAWKGYSEQKNLANQLASYDWILSLDADEEVSAALREEISVMFKNVPAVAAYSIPRKTIYGGRWIRHGGWYPNRLVRLFDKTQGKWKGTELHEKWETKGPVGSLGCDLIHYSFENIADQVSRNNHYSTLGALKLYKEGTRFSLGQMVRKTLSKFVETLFLKRGFLDGYPGFIISVSAAYSVFLKWAKLWELTKSEKS